MLRHYYQGTRLDGSGRGRTAAGTSSYGAAARAGERVHARVRLGLDGRFALRRSPRHDVRYRARLKNAVSPVVRVDVTG